MAMPKPAAQSNSEIERSAEFAYIRHVRIPPGIAMRADALRCSACRFGGITVTIVVLIPRSDPAWPVVFHRLAEVSVGIGASLIFARVWQEREATSQYREHALK